MVDTQQNPHRVTCSIVCFALGAGFPVLFFTLSRATMFYGAPNDSGDFPRYVWCCCMALVGFGGLVWYYRHEAGAPYLQFLTWHFPMLIGATALVCGGLHLFPASSGYVFYYLSAGACIFLGFSAEQLLSLFHTTLEHGGKET